MITAICHKTLDPWTQKSYSQLRSGENYSVLYAIIGRSLTQICLVEFPDELFNSILFTFQKNGEPFDLIQDFIEMRAKSCDNSMLVTTVVLYMGLSERRLNQIKLTNFPITERF